MTRAQNIERQKTRIEDTKKAIAYRKQQLRYWRAFKATNDVGKMKKAAEIKQLKSMIESNTALLAKENAKLKSLKTTSPS